MSGCLRVVDGVVNGKAIAEKDPDCVMMRRKLKRRRPPKLYSKTQDALMQRLDGDASRL